MSADLSRPPASDSFDAYAGGYEEAIGQGLSLTGESTAYFAEGRVRWLSRCLAKRAFEPRTVLDFGCGTGNSVPLFFEHLGAERVAGVDASAESLAVAARRCEALAATFARPAQAPPRADVDLAFCNGVFHHIPSQEQPDALDYLFQSLRKGGLFAFWENNPWNPMTRYVMRRIPFDADAVLLWPAEARRLLRAAGFEILRTDYLFIFPRALRALRVLEPLVSAVPLGGQYQILCRRPA